jgi:hypothetical protein
MHLALWCDANVLVKLPQQTGFGGIEIGCVGEDECEAARVQRRVARSEVVDGADDTAADFQLNAPSMISTRKMIEPKLTTKRPFHVVRSDDID